MKSLVESIHESLLYEKYDSIELIEYIENDLHCKLVSSNHQEFDTQYYGDAGGGQTYTYKNVTRQKFDKLVKKFDLIEVKSSADDQYMRKSFGSHLEHYRNYDESKQNDGSVPQVNFWYDSKVEGLMLMIYY